MKGLVLLAVLAALSLLAHASLESALSSVDLVDALLVRGSLLRAALAAALLLVRVFLIFVAPAWALASSLSALGTRK